LGEERGGGLGGLLLRCGGFGLCCIVLLLLLLGGGGGRGSLGGLVGYGFRLGVLADGCRVVVILVVNLVLGSGGLVGV
jgi:hypothetical protein